MAVQPYHVGTRCTVTETTTGDENAATVLHIRRITIKVMKTVMGIRHCFEVCENGKLTMCDNSDQDLGRACKEECRVLRQHRSGLSR